jgi:hypothetical protein
MVEPQVLSEARVAYWVEKAAAHQCRALRCLREARGQGTAVLRSSETRTRRDEALQSLLAARGAVLRAQAMSSGTEHSRTIEEHLAQLDALVQAVERECSETPAGRVAGLTS